jgi:hypothetical protein
VLDIDTGVNDVDIDTLATGTMIFILGEGAERELRAVADARETLKKDCMSMSHIHGEMSALLTHPGSSPLDFLGPDDLIALNIVHFRHFPNPLENSVRELASVAFDMAVEHVTNPTIIV